MLRYFFYLFLIHVLSLALLSCTFTDSKGIATSQLYVRYTATEVSSCSSGSTCKVQALAQFTVGRGATATVVELSSGDKISCKVGAGNPVTLTKVTDVGTVLGNITYGGDCGAPAGNNDVVFIFTRSTSESYESMVKVPPPILGAVYDPAIAPSTPVANGGTVNLNWTPVVPASNPKHETTIELFSQGSSGAHSSGPRKVLELAQPSPNAFRATLSRSLTPGDTNFDVSAISASQDMNFVIERTQEGSMAEGLNGIIRGVRRATLGSFKVAE